MNFKSRHLQRLSQKAIAPFIVLSVLGYFVYHSVQGDRGILAWMQLQERFLKIQSELIELTQVREELEEKVQGLQPESIKRDLLDQQVRLQLGYIRPDEVVILKVDKEEELDSTMMSPAVE
ncbi:MAG: septum formation initiator family protein [Proteobacteria bacterium]|nr:septum formation initiator family protein [Pseudomonadota bacterium]